MGKMTCYAHIKELRQLLRYLEEDIRNGKRDYIANDLCEIRGTTELIAEELEID